MSTPPPGWIETGVAQTFTGTATLRVRGVNADAVVLVSLMGFSVQLEVRRDGAPLSCGEWGSSDSVTLFRQNFVGPDTDLTTEAGSCPAPYLSVPVSWTITGARLVTGYLTPTGSRVLAYRVWIDGGTTLTLNIGAYSESWNGLAITGLFRSVNWAVTTLAAGGFGAVPAPLTDAVRVENITWGGQADPTTLDLLPFTGVTGLGGGIAGDLTSYAPLNFTADVRVEECAGGTPIHDVRVTNGVSSSLIANPGTLAITIWRAANTAAEHSVYAELYGAWSSGGMEPRDRDVPVRQLIPKRPGSAPEYWTPASLTVAATKSVLLSTNTWSGTGSVAMSGAGNSTWTVSGLGASVARVLKGVYSSTTSYLRTLHAAGDDVWGWGLYSYLDIDLTASVSATLTVTVRYNVDPSLATTADRTYTVNATSGTHTYRLDLPFPNEGGPDYWERATRITVSGFAVGVYTINSATLTSDEDPYLKVAATGFGYPGLVLTCDGSYPSYHWGGNPIYTGVFTRKDQECGEDASELSLTLGGSVSMDGTISDTMTELALMEGMTSTYSGATIAADLTDGTNVFGSFTAANYLAYWLHDVMNARPVAGVATDLLASPLFDQVDLCSMAAGVLTIPFRVTLGTQLEALCVDSLGARATAGKSMVARRSATGTPVAGDPAVGVGTTDASGFVVVPVPAGEVGEDPAWLYLEGL